MKSFLLEIKLLLSRMFCLFYDNYLSPFSARAMGAEGGGGGKQESFFAFYHNMLVKLVEVKPMKVKLMSLREVKPTNVWGTESPKSFSLSH